jgi:hypothetical protein
LEGSQATPTVPIWGKAAYETRGIAWTMAAHFLIDIAVMAAYFV